MGSYAHSNIIFGYAWSPDDIESEEDGELLEQFIADWGFDKVLSVEYHGDFNSGWTGHAVTVSRLGWHGSIGEITDLTLNNVEHPNEEEYRGLRKVADHCGLDIGEFGYKLIVDFS